LLEKFSIFKFGGKMGSVEKEFEKNEREVSPCGKGGKLLSKL